jgi:hypothetical protein
MKRNKPSHLESFQFVLIRASVIISVNIRRTTEKILSLKIIVKKLISHHSGSKQETFSRFNGVITEDIQMIHKTLKISEPITFQTPISYLFLIIAASVAAISGRLVPAATIVAPIAHSDTQACSAI